jgi:gliding motility-associated lipoprotein GldD
MHFTLKNTIPFFITFILLLACNSDYTSKKTGYYKIDFPEKKYQLFDEPSFPYSFEYPVYANIVKDSTYFDSNPENDYWRNIDFVNFNAKIFLSYKSIGGKALYKVKIADGKYRDSLGVNAYDKMINDAFNLTNKNEDVATSKKDSLFKTSNNISGLLFKLSGNAATQRQFFMTDTTTNFIRGALYFYASPNADSVKPVLDFIQKDIDHIISTFKWKNKLK